MNQESTRWRRRKEARPAEILQAALVCFKERGFAATRLEDVAMRAGVTKGTIYLYYADKEELFKAVVRGELLPNIERLETALSDSVPASALLERFFVTWIREIIPSPVSVIPKLVLAEAGNFPELARFYYETAVKRGLRLIASVINRGVASGEFRPVDVDHVVFSVVGPLLLTVLWKHSLGPHVDEPLDSEAVCRAHLDVILHGLANVQPAKDSRHRSQS